MKLLIGGVNHTVAPTGIHDDGQGIGLSDTLNARGVLSLQMRDYSKVWSPAVGAPVLLYSPDDATLKFGGSIEARVLTDSPDYVGYRDLDLTVVDYNQIPGRFLAAEVYVNKTTGYIVEDLRSKYLAADGVTAGTIQAGPTLDVFVVPYWYVDAAFNKLADLTGFQWTIDRTKALWFADRLTTAAPFGIDANSTHVISITVKDSRDQYRNKQYVAGGTTLTAIRTESFVGDGVLRSFMLAFPAGAAPTVTVNGVSKTVGIGGVSTGKDWYWNAGSVTIAQDTGGTVLGTGDTLAVTYQGQFSILALAQDDSAIAARKAVEGGSGIYENRLDQSAITSVALGNTTAAALLSRYNAPLQVDLVLDGVDGLQAGQLLPIDRSDLGLSGAYLIKSVTATGTYADGRDYWTYTITAVDGTAVGGWVQFFLKLAEATRATLQTANLSISLLRQFTDGVVCGDSLTVSSSAPESRIGTARIGFAEIAA